MVARMTKLRCYLTIILIFAFALSGKSQAAEAPVIPFLVQQRIDQVFEDFRTAILNAQDDEARRQALEKFHRELTVMLHYLRRGVVAQTEDDFIIEQPDETISQRSYRLSLGLMALERYEAGEPMGLSDVQALNAMVGKGISGRTSERVVSSDEDEVFYAFKDPFSPDLRQAIVREIRGRTQALIEDLKSATTTHPELREILAELETAVGFLQLELTQLEKRLSAGATIPTLRSRSEEKNFHREIALRINLGRETHSGQDEVYRARKWMAQLGEAFIEFEKWRKTSFKGILKAASGFHEFWARVAASRAESKEARKEARRVRSESYGPDNNYGTYPSYSTTRNQPQKYRSPFAPLGKAVLMHLTFTALVAGFLGGTVWMGDGFSDPVSFYVPAMVGAVVGGAGFFIGGAGLYWHACSQTIANLKAAARRKREEDRWRY
jgi:hypothetical protein